MCFLKTLLIFCAILTVCYCDSMKKKHKHKHHYEYDLYWHGFHYLTFLILKFKVIFVLGSIFTIGLFAGKLFAIYKFAEYMKKSDHFDHHEDNHEKIIYLNSHNGPTHDFPPAGGFSAPGAVFDKPYSNGGGSYPPGFSLDQPPPNAQISGAGGNFEGPGQLGPSQSYGPPLGLGGPGQSGPSQSYGPPNGFGRSNNVKENSIYDNFNLFTRIIKKLNITEMAFYDMNLKTDDCKRKFVCETDFNVNQSSILRAVFEMFSDDSYLRYKTKKAITTFNECTRLYPNCTEMT